MNAEKWFWVSWALSLQHGTSQWNAPQFSSRLQQRRRHAIRSKPSEVLYKHVYRWNGCHKFQRLDIDARLILSGFREVGASHILRSWSYESPKQNHFRFKLMTGLNKWGTPQLDRRTWRHAGVSGGRYSLLLHYSYEAPHFHGEGTRGGQLWLYFVYWGCAAPKGMFFTISVWEGCCFRPNSLARGVFWSWFDTARSSCK